MDDEPSGRMVKTAIDDVHAVRIRTEAQVLAAGQLPGVVRLVGLEGDTDRPVLVTGRIDGPDLGRAGDLALEEVAGVVAALATTLADLHGLGLVHGAVMPSHVLLGPDGRPVLCGFGYGGPSGEAPVAEAPLPSGQRDPARRPGDPLAPSADVYALGALLRERLAHVPPAPDRRRRADDRRLGEALAVVADRATTADPALRIGARSLAEAVSLAAPCARLPRRADVDRPPSAAGPDASALEEFRPRPPVPPRPAAELRHPLRGIARARQPAQGAAQGRHPAQGAARGRHPAQGAARGRHPAQGAARGRHPAQGAARGRHPDRRAAWGRLPRLLVAGGMVLAAVAVAAGLRLAVTTKPDPVRGAAAAPTTEAAPATTAPRSPVTGAAAGTASTRPGPDGPSPVPVRPGCAAVSGSLVADTDADGCPEALRWNDGVVEAGGRRWAVGHAGDRVAVADWSCRGRATVALLRPATGEVFVFDAWARSGHDVVAEVAGRVEGGFAIRAADLGDGCPRVAVERADGPPVTLPAATGPTTAPAAAPAPP